MVQGQSCLFSNDGFAFCGNSPVLNPLPSIQNGTCATSQCPVNHPCGDAPCVILNGLIACLHALSPVVQPTTTPTPTVAPITATSIAVSVCPFNHCNGSPCLFVNGVSNCFCSSNTTGPYCTPIAGK